MGELMTTQQVLQLLASMIGGGLAGSALTIIYNRWYSSQIAAARQKGTIAALAGELRRSSLLCSHNAGLKVSSTALFIHFPVSVATKATFEDRHSYPALAPLQSDLELCVLSAIHMNELIDLHHSMIPAVDHTGSHRVTKDRDDLKNKIAMVCDGTQKLEGIAPDKSIVLPEFIGHLTKRISEL